MIIYHIVRSADWDRWKNKSYYEAESLETEGFIHCSFEDQLTGVIERYYNGEPVLVILSIDPSLLVSKLVSELSTNSEMYPHIYGPINRDAVIEVRTIPHAAA
jgi:uncharacterized protein (DUF952 family)